jgi:hypothetical protein
MVAVAENGDEWKMRDADSAFRMWPTKSRTTEAQRSQRYRKDILLGKSRKAGTQEKRWACGSRLKNRFFPCFPAFLIFLLGNFHASLRRARSVRGFARKLA